MSNQEQNRKQILPVWFFVGLLLTVYGIILLLAGFRSLSHPPAVVLAQYHSGIWGGVVLLAIGGFYTLHFWPKGAAEHEHQRCGRSGSSNALLQNDADITSAHK